MSFLPRYIPMPRTIAPEMAARFWALVEKAAPDRCWHWRSVTSSAGYGQFKINGARYGAHRVAFFISQGRDPRDLQICHRCDNPLCCNPDHLFVGTHDDNMADKVAKGRARGRFSR